MRTVAFCERDEYCRAVLRKHWPDIPCIHDIHAIDADGLGRLGPIDIVCGGFPCQPFSVAGKQRAQDDDRHLWPQMRRVIALARPTWIIGENVTGLIPLALDDVLLDLENLGYATRTFVIPAVAVDARHRRDRVWIVARDTHIDSKPVGAIHAEMEELCGTVANASGERGWQEQLRCGDSPIARNDGEARSVANTDGLRQPRFSGGWEERTTERGEDVRHASDNSTISPRAGWREPARDWGPEPDVGRVAHGVPRRVDRLRALGNAVVPQVVEEIGRAIMRAA
jgi:DNA (cytosine-5)-methyltransferase 1